MEARISENKEFNRNEAKFCGVLKAAAIKYEHGLISCTAGQVLSEGRSSHHILKLLACQIRPKTSKGKIGGL